MLLIALAAAAFAGAFLISSTKFHYATVTVAIPGNHLEITVLLPGRRNRASCEAAATGFANSTLAVCPACQITERACLDALGPQGRKLLSEEPLEIPSARLPNGGVIAYRSARPGISLAACKQSEKQASAQLGNGRITCHEPGLERPGLPLQERFRDTSGGALGPLLVVLGSLFLCSACYLLARRKNLHAYLSSLPRPVKRILMLGTDIVIVAFALVIALYAQHGTRWVDVGGLELTLLLALLVAIPAFIASGLYSTFIRYMDLRVAVSVAGAVTTAVLLLAGLLSLLGIHSLNLETSFVFWAFSLLGVGGSRLAARSYFRRPLPSATSLERAIIYGAGEAGAQLVASLRIKPELMPVALVDDNPDAAGSRVYGIQVHHASRLAQLIRELDVRQLLLAIPSASKERRREIFSRVEGLGVRIRTIPPLSALVAGRSAISDIDDITVEDLVGRDITPPHPGLLDHCIKGKTVLVTGAGGSIGSELCRQIAGLRPTRMVLVDQSEYALYSINEELASMRDNTGHGPEVVPILASVTPRNMLRKILAGHRVNTIYHAAAYKHVPMVEMNVTEAVYNNVVGTLRAAQAALAANVETFVLVSTDKAVRPTNVMGASKRLAELIVQSMNGAATRFCIVRFGNVLDSSGSVVPLFRKQIHAGGPVSVTHPEVTRYFMTIPEAAQLVLQAGAMAGGADVFVLDMGKPVRILDLARKMISLSGLTVRNEQNPDGAIEITFTGLRPGEKLHEELLIGESVSGTPHPLIMRAMETSIPWTELAPVLTAIEQACVRFEEDRVRQLLCSIVPITREQAGEGVQESAAVRPAPLKLIH